MELAKSSSASASSASASAAAKDDGADAKHFDGLAEYFSSAVHAYSKPKQACKSHYFDLVDERFENEFDSTIAFRATLKSDLISIREMDDQRFLKFVNASIACTSIKMRLVMKEFVDIKGGLMELLFHHGLLLKHAAISAGIFQRRCTVEARKIRVQKNKIGDKALKESMESISTERRREIFKSVASDFILLQKICEKNGRDLKDLNDVTVVGSAMESVVLLRGMEQLVALLKKAKIVLPPNSLEESIAALEPFKKVHGYPIPILSLSTSCAECGCEIGFQEDDRV